MYYMLLLVALAGCAHAAAAAVPAYLNAYSNHNGARLELLKHLNFTEPNAQQANYMALKVAVSLIADLNLHAKVKPEDVYDVLTSAVASLSSSTLAKVARDVAKERDNRALERTASLRALIKKLCLPSGAKAGATCDAEVDKVVKKDRMLPYESPVLFAINDAGLAYLQLKDELNNASKSGKSVREYFKIAKQKLLDLVFLTVKLYDLTDRIRLYS